MNNTKILLIDSDDYTASVLLEDLKQRGFTNLYLIPTSLDLPQLSVDSKPDLVIFNYHFDQPESLINCSSVKDLLPLAAVMAIASAGPAMKSVQAWANQTNSIDVVIQKPLSDERFFTALEGLIKNNDFSRNLENKAARLANLLPEGALASIDRSHSTEAEMFDAAVLFTDIRRSSEVITSMPPREFFQLLNKSLSMQAKIIKQFEGSVVKYTGDGVMAIFRGMGRSYLALRCGLELAHHASENSLPYGIGVADGLVLAGFIGDSNQAGQRQQYDVIGATVHLAARLCSMASSGEVIATNKINSRARLATSDVRPIGTVAIRGFEVGIDCVAFKPANSFIEIGV
ncbi:MAG TPA: adenylate/guanylate cyclase domain-containing protein [Methylotenera sp.]|nr:adenylate/guanylate cyclase domain-containing protein [Methylotenera sp.]